MKKAGIAYPFTNSIHGVLGNKSEKESILSSVQNILTTPKGSIIYDQKLGSIVPYLVFEPIDETSVNLIFYYVVEDIETQDPRVKITSIEIKFLSTRKITVILGIVNRNDPQQQQIKTGISFSK